MGHTPTIYTMYLALTLTLQLAASAGLRTSRGIRTSDGEDYDDLLLALEKSRQQNEENLKAFTKSRDMQERLAREEYDRKISQHEQEYQNFAEVARQEYERDSQMNHNFLAEQLDSIDTESAQRLEWMKFTSHYPYLYDGLSEPEPSNDPLLEKFLKEDEEEEEEFDDELDDEYDEESGPAFVEEDEDASHKKSSS